MTPDNFEGVEEPRKTWCQNRMTGLRKWLSSYGRYGCHIQIEAALERIAGLESLLNEKAGIDGLNMSVPEFVKLYESTKATNELLEILSDFAKDYIFLELIGVRKDKKDVFLHDRIHPEFQNRLYIALEEFRKLQSSRESGVNNA